MDCENCKVEIIKKYGSGRFCSSKCARGFSTKIKRKEINLSVSEKLKNNYTGRNNTFYKKNPFYKKLIKKCPICNEDFLVLKCNENKIYCSRKCYINDVDFIGRKKPNTGGYRERSGIGRSGYYNGIWCNSSYELAWVIWAIDNSIKFERNLKGFNYIFEGRSRKYYPDFKLEEGYLEIKGYNSNQFKAKLEYFIEDIKVLYKKDLDPILEYVKNKYGKDYIRLYGSS